MSSETPSLEPAVIAAIRTVHDPEIPVNLYDLGLIYGLEIDETGVVRIRMTLTTPNCPVAETLPQAVQAAVESVEGVSAATIDLVFDPPWTPDLMSEDARMQLDMMGISWADPNDGPQGPKTTGLTIGGDRPGRRRPGDKSGP